MTETHVPYLNAANVLTYSRVALVPVFAWLLIFREPAAPVAAALVFAGASATDGLDGWVARRWNLTSGFGAFSDQLADKLLVGTALIALALDSRLSWVAVVLIAGRDVIVTILRIALARRGKALPPSRDAKAKTAIQIVAVLMLTALDPGHALAIAVATIAVVLTVWTGGRYVVAAARGRAGEEWR